MASEISGFSELFHQKPDAGNKYRLNAHHRPQEPPGTESQVHGHRRPRSL